MPLTLGAVSVAFIALGLYALVRRRPFVINGRWMLAMFVATMSPQVIMQLSWVFVDDRNLSSRKIMFLK